MRHVFPPGSYRPALERMIYIAGELRRRRAVSVSEVARRFEVSTKSIRRDLQFLRDRMRYDVEYSGEVGGWVLLGAPAARL